MKKVVVLASIISVLLVVNLAMADSSSGTPFAAIWEAINGLQQQVNEIDHNFPGAGNIAFISSQVGDWVWVLTNDGAVWAKPFDGDWQIDLEQVPIPVSEIVQWEPDHFLDSNGNLWIYNPYEGVWANVGHPQ